MTVADLTRFSLANCNTAVDVADYLDLPITDYINDSSGLPFLKVSVNGRNCKVLLDSGSKLNLVSKSFLVNNLNTSSDRIKSTNVLVKGVSSNVFRPLEK